MRTGPILLLIGENQGGLSDVCSAYVNYFRLSDNDFHLLVMSENRKRKSAGAGMSVMLIADIQRPTKKDVSQLEKMIGSIKPSLIMTEPLLFPLVHTLDVPLVADIHYLMAKNNSVTRNVQPFFRLDTELDLQFRYQLLQKELLEKKILSRANLIITNSQGTKKDLQENYPRVVSGKVRVAEVKSIVPVQHFIPPSKRMKTFAYSGRFNSIKGVDLLPGIAEKLKIRTDAFGASREVLEQFSDSFSGHSHFKAHPWTFDGTKLSRSLESSRFHLFPSFYEPWGLSLTKSLRSGAICIANAQSSGHQEQIRNGVNGFLLDFASADLHERLSEILALPVTELDKMAVRNRMSTCQGDDYVKNVLTLLKGVRHERK